MCLGRGLGSIFPTITPKCLTQLTVPCVRVEVLVFIRGNPLWHHYVNGLFIFFLPLLIYFTNLLILKKRPVIFQEK